METGARVVFPGPNDTDKTSIVIMGKEEDVGKAKAILEERISHFVSCLLLRICIFPRLSLFCEFIKNINSIKLTNKKYGY